MVPANGAARALCCFVAVATHLMPVVASQNIADPDLLRQTSPGLYANVSCTGVNECQKIELLGLLWETGGPSHVAFGMRYSFERMLRMINHHQEILPGYELVIDWHNDKWDPYEAMKIMGKQLGRHPNRYVGVVQGSDPAAEQISIVAHENRLPHLGFHIAASLSDRTRAPGYWRTCTAVLSIVPGVIQLFARLGWRRLGIVYDPVQFPLEAKKSYNMMQAAGLQVNFSLPVGNYDGDLSAIVDTVRLTGLRVLLVWGEPVASKPLVCALAKAQIAGVKLIIIPDAPFYNVPIDLEKGAFIQNASISCDADVVAALASGSLMIGPSIARMDGHLLKLGVPSPPAANHSLTCLPSGGPNAGGDFVHWWFTAMKPLIDPRPNIPHLNAADSACLWALALRHMLIDGNLTVANLTSGSQGGYHAMREWLSTATIPHGVTGQVSFPDRNSGDQAPNFGVFQVAQGPGRGDPTGTGLFDLRPLGPWPGPGLQNAAFDNVGDTFEECEPGHVRVGELRTVAGRPSWASVCQPCGPGTAMPPMALRVRQGPPTCERCPAGRMQPLAGQTACKRCAKGRFSNASVDQCLPCAAGTFADSEGLEKCVQCLVGSFASDEGQVTCERCPLGRHMKHKGRTACFLCDGDLTTEYPGAASSQYCACPAGRYRDREARLSCRPVPSGMESAFGADEENFASILEAGTGEKLNATLGRVYPVVLEGFWASEAEPLNIYRCTNRQSCPGGGPNSCSHGREGIACARCKRGLWKHEPGHCSECDGSGAEALVTLAILLLIVAALCLHAFSNAPVSRRTSAIMNMTIMSGMLLTTFMAMSVFGSIEVDWPAAFDSVISFARLFVLDIGILRPECVFEQSLVQEYISKQLLPIIIVAVLLIAFIFTKFLMPEKYKMNVDSSFNTVCQIMQMFYLTMAASCVMPFQCYAHPQNGQESLRQHPDLICWQGEHVTLLVAAGFFILLYPIGIMAVTVFCVYKAKEGVSDRFKRRCKFVLFRFRPGMAWWSPLLLLRNFALPLIPILPGVRGDAVIQSILICFVIMFYLIILVAKAPWRTTLQQFIDAMLTGVLLIISITGMAFTPMSEPSGFPLVILLGSVSLMLLCFCVLWVYQCVMVLNESLLTVNKGIKGIDIEQKRCERRRGELSNNFASVLQALEAQPGGAGPAMRDIINIMLDYELHQAGCFLTAVRGITVSDILVAHEAPAAVHEEGHPSAAEDEEEEEVVL